MQFRKQVARQFSSSSMRLLLLLGTPQDDQHTRQVMYWCTQARLVSGVAGYSLDLKSGMLQGSCDILMITQSYSLSIDTFSGKDL